MSSFLGLGTTVHDVTTGELLVDIPNDFFGELSPDGSIVSVGNFEPGGVVYLYEVESGRLVDRLTGLGDTPFDFDFTPDGSRLLAGSRGNAAAVWDLGTGLLEVSIPGAGNTVWSGYDPSTDRFWHLAESVLTVWDLGPGSDESAPQRLEGGVQGNSFATKGASGALLLFDPEPTVVPFDPVSGTIGSPSIDVNMGRPPAIFEDGRIVVHARLGSYSDPEQLSGPAVIWDPAFDSTTPLIGCAALTAELVESVRGAMAGPCAGGSGDWLDVDRFFLSPDSSELLVTTGLGELIVLDTSTLEVSARHQIEGAGGVVGFGGDWIAVSSNPTGVVSTSEETTFYRFPSLEEVRSVPGRNEETSSDGSMLALHDRPGGMTIYDTSTWEAISSPGFGDARIRGMAFSLDGSKFMSSGTDGFVRIWDTADGAELDRIPLDGVSDGYWLDDAHIVVGTSEGLWTVLSLDVEEVLEAAEEKLTRTFTSEECDTYRIDPCPTLDEMRSR
jgi:WD40 repeat protein